jgi:multiple sugar transport system substrate-binding protein
MFVLASSNVIGFGIIDQPVTRVQIAMGRRTRITPEGPYEGDNGADIDLRFSGETLRELELISQFRVDAQNLFGMNGDLRRLGIVLTLLRDHFSGRSTTTSSLASSSGLSYSSAYRAIDSMTSDGSIVKRKKTSTGKSFSLHPSSELLAAWQGLLARNRVFGRRQTGQTTSAKRSKSKPKPEIINAPAVLQESIKLKRGLRLLMHADPTFMAMNGLQRRFEMILGVQIKSKALSIDRLSREIERNSKRKLSEYDVIACDLPWFGELVAAGRLQPLDLISSESEEDNSDYYPDAISCVRQNEKLYGTPILTTAEMLVFRRDIFEKLGFVPPRETSDVIRISKEIMSSGLAEHGIAWNGARGTALGHTFMTIMAAHGQPIVELKQRPDGFEVPPLGSQRPKAMFMHAAAFAAAEYLRDLLAVSPPNVLSMNWYDRARFYTEGKVGIAYSHTLLANLFELDPSSIAYENTGYAPHPTGLSGKPIAPLGGYALAIPSNIDPSRIDGARKAICALTSREASKLYVANGSLASPRYSVNADPEVAAMSPIIGVVDGMSKSGILRMWPRPPVPGISSIISIAGEEIHDVLSGKTDLSSALRAAQDRSDQL